MENFKHSVEITVRFHDLDAFGHVNNARYLNYLEMARLGYVTDVCGWDGTLGTLGVIVANVNIDYKKPIFLGDALRIYTRVSRLGNKSFELEYVFEVTPHGTQTPQVAATARTTMVTFDYTLNQSVPVFPTWRAAMLAYEPALQA